MSIGIDLVFLFLNVINIHLKCLLLTLSMHLAGEKN